jgi:hypothetical protein
MVCSSIVADDDTYTQIGKQGSIFVILALRARRVIHVITYPMGLIVYFIHQTCSLDTTRLSQHNSI